MTKVYQQNCIETIKIIDLSGNENYINVDVQNIDRDVPVISVINLQNSNTQYETYASKIHVVTATIKITDMKISSNIDISEINIFVEENCNACRKEIKNLEQSDTEIVFDLVLSSIQGNGNLNIVIPENFVTDVAGNNSRAFTFNTEIIIDNAQPEGEYFQEVLQNGKVNACIKSTEEIQPLNDWETADNIMFSKVFPANVSYIIEIYDFAQNKSQVEVNVTNATYIVLTYASHNSEVGWTYGLGNYDIAGKEAVKKSPAYKTEALAFRITGGVGKDFVKVKGYVNSYWNSSSDYGRCNSTGYKYKLGNVEELSMASSDLSTIGGKQYIQLGGAGINLQTNRDYYGNNPIPAETIYNAEPEPYPFGVSEISISLQDYSELSVVYQILVSGKGWLKTTNNGQSASAGKTFPMSAIRAAIIPNSEVEKLTQLWNSDIGTYKVD